MNGGPPEASPPPQFSFYSEISSVLKLLLPGLCLCVRVCVRYSRQFPEPRGAMQTRKVSAMYSINTRLMKEVRGRGGEPRRGFPGSLAPRSPPIVPANFYAMP